MRREGKLEMHIYIYMTLEGKMENTIDKCHANTHIWHLVVFSIIYIYTTPLIFPEQHTDNLRFTYNRPDEFRPIEERPHGSKKAGLKPKKTI